MYTSISTVNGSLRRAIYSGEVIVLRANETSQSLAAAVNEHLEGTLGRDGPVRQAQFRLNDDEFFQLIGALRKHFYTAPVFHEMVSRLMSSVGFEPREQAFDPIRLRVIRHGGHHAAASRPMYYGHRDTWYANPACMITWWVPLHDVCAEETFEFFPEEFARCVANDSEIFDFDAWVVDGQERRIGWQNKETGQTAGYPRLLEEPRGPRAVACGAGDILLFSAQQLHQTRPNNTGATRFSIDFETVDLGDHAAGLGPRNVDNRSTGCSLGQFIHAGVLAHPNRDN